MDNNLENNQNNLVDPQKSNGALIGVVVIIIILIIGGIYLVKSKVEEVKQIDTLATDQDNTANTLSGADDMNSIETDLNNNANIDALPNVQE